MDDARRRTKRTPTTLQYWRQRGLAGVRRGYHVSCKSAGINIDQHPQTGEYHLGRPMQCSAEGQTRQRGILQHDHPTFLLLHRALGRLLIVSYRFNQQPLPYTRPSVRHGSRNPKFPPFDDPGQPCLVCPRRFLHLQHHPHTPPNQNLLPIGRSKRALPFTAFTSKTVAGEPKLGMALRLHMLAPFRFFFF
jgi:hypothetical protein